VFFYFISTIFRQISAQKPTTFLRVRFGLRTESQELGGQRGAGCQVKMQEHKSGCSGRIAQFGGFRLSNSVGGMNAFADLTAKQKRQISCFHQLLKVYAFASCGICLQICPCCC
jgi:hypothetical protein